MADDLQQVVERLVAQLADLLAMTCGRPVRALPAVGTGAIDWHVPVTLEGASAPSAAIGLTAAAAQRLTAVMLGADVAHPDDSVVDALHAALSQAAAAVAGAPASTVRLTIGVPVQEAITPPAGAWQHDLLMEDGDPPRIVVWRTVPVTTTRDATAAVDRGEEEPAARTHRNLDVVLDLELPITVRFGETRLTLDALARLGAGSLIDLERAPDDPVDLLVNGRLVARGEVVVVSGCYGVRIREVVSAADRLRSLEG